MPVTGKIDLISETTGKRIARALERYELDGTPETYKAEMRRFFVNGGGDGSDPEKLTELVDEWYALTRDDWCGWTEFYQPDVSAVTTGTKGGDNAGLTCVPSTDSEANQDDYAGLPLFACVDCNWEIDEDTGRPVITAIDGITNNFERYNPLKYVGVLQMAGWFFYEEKEDTYIRGYSANPHGKCEPLPDAVDLDGSVRSWVVHGKYASHTYDGKMTCCAGLIPTTYLSHNTVQTLAKANGELYSGETTCDDFFIKLMMYIKYGSLTLDGILQGCCSCNYQYYAQVAEEGVKRVILTTANAANLEVGMGVLLGTYDASASSPTDRGTAAVYSITGQAGAQITAIEDITIDGTAYKAIYIDVDEAFDTAANGSATDGSTLLSSFHWPTGKTDAVLGNDGSPVSCTSGKYPAKIQGIEYMVGPYEILSDVILNLYQEDDGSCFYEPYICRRAERQSTAIDSNYEATGILCPDEVTSAAWGYIKKLGYAKGVFFPIELGGSSTTYTRDAFYQAAKNTLTREWVARGYLSSGVAAAGVSCMYGYNALSSSRWYCASRLSAGGNRGEFAA